MGAQTSAPTASAFASSAAGAAVLVNALQVQELVLPRADMSDAELARAAVVLLNTLPVDQQDCLVAGTLCAAHEEPEMNRRLQSGAAEVARTVVVVYGAHHSDPSVWRKVQSLRDLGFPRVFVYAGGMFEWLLMQNAFGADNFPTRGRELDLLRFRPPPAPSWTA